MRLTIFKVSLSSTGKAQVRELYRRAVRSNLGQVADEALRRAVRKLESEPELFGDPLYKLKNSQGSVHHGVCSPFLFHFALFESPRVVFVINVFALPASGIEEK